MQFKKVFRGYDPQQVDKYISETADREGATRRAQRERIDELSEENYNLRERIVELQRRQNDVAEAMIVAQKVAADIEQNAKDYADRALVEAKKFYATWQAYSKTIVASFTDDELAAFTGLERKIGDVIANYESKLKGAVPPSKRNSAPKMTPDEFVKRMEQAADELNAKSLQAEQVEQENPVSDEPVDSDATAVSAEKAKPTAAKPSNSKTHKETKSANPITRVEQAAGQSVDLKELLRPQQSLEDLCADLGLIESADDPADE